MISWLNGNKKHVTKYSKLYTDQGLDVLVGQPSKIDFMFNWKSTKVREKISNILMTFITFLQQFGQDIADLLQSNEDQYKKIFIHGFSVGAGMWAMTQKMIAEVSFLIIGNNRGVCDSGIFLPAGSAKIWQNP
jgi:Eukaryotic protein of unknown function (DUF829)